MRSCRCAVEQCLSHSAIESKVLLSAKQRYLPSAVRLGPKFCRLVRLNVLDKNSPPTKLEQSCAGRKTFVVSQRSSVLGWQLLAGEQLCRFCFFFYLMASERLYSSSSSGVCRRLRFCGCVWFGLLAACASLMPTAIEYF